MYRALTVLALTLLGGYVVFVGIQYAFMNYGQQIAMMAGSMLILSMLFRRRHE